MGDRISGGDVAIKTMTMKYADNKLSAVIAGAQDYMFGKLTKRKTRIEASSVITIHEHQGREIEIYYMVCSLAASSQSDLSMDAYSIECVKYKGRKVKLSGKGEQELLTYLNCTNPARVKFNN